MLFLKALFDAMVRVLAARNLRSDRFGTIAAIVGVALGAATVNVVLVLDVNTMRVEAGAYASDPSILTPPDTIGLAGFRADGTPVPPVSARQATHEDYEVMRSAIRLSSLAAFLVGALIVFFTFGVVVDRRRREVALLRSLGALPRQVAAVFVREALIIGVIGAVLGFVASIPMAYLGAAGGVTTTGRARIALATMVFPWSGMALVSAVGAATAVLGVLRPVRDVLRMDVPQTLRPRFLDQEGARLAARRAKGITLIALPFMVLVYALMRPFFQRALPSLTFFVLEAGLTCVAFLATLLLVPELVRRVGGSLARLLPGRAGPERLLLQRRIEHQGHELSWSVSGVMLVFSLLLALHIATFALKQEVVIWARSSLHGEIFLYPVIPGRQANPDTTSIPKQRGVVHFSGRTPWPNAVQAVDSEELAALFEATGRQELASVARRMGPGRVVLTKMMARRYRVRVGDLLELSGRGGKKRLEIVAVTDAIGFLPYPTPYRIDKTFATIDVADQDLILPYANPVGVAGMFAPASRGAAKEAVRSAGVGRFAVNSAQSYTDRRVRETDRDFVIFDVVLLLTSVLAAIGIANQLVLSVHARQREIALYRVLGMTSAQVRSMVRLEGAFLGLLGGGLAALLGVPLGFSAIGALKSVSAFEVNFRLPLHYVVITVLVAVLVALLASLYPASRAGRTDSAESVHYE